MAFNVSNLYNIYSGPPGFGSYVYKSDVDTQATVLASGYFNNVDDEVNFNIGDVIFVTGLQGGHSLRVSGVIDGSVSTENTIVGSVHIKISDNGGPSANIAGDDLVIENSENVGMSLLGPDPGTASIYFGNPSSNDIARISAALASEQLITYVNAKAITTASGLGFTINETGDSFLDFRVEGDTSTHLLFTDASANRVGVSLSGNLVTDGLFHIASASAGAVTASVNADELVIEGSGETGLSILAGPTSGSNIFFGSSASNVAGKITYNHANNFMQFHTNTAEQFRINAVGVLMIGGIGSAPASAAGVLNIFNDTSPTAASANGIAIGSKDSSDGATNATLEIWTEQAEEATATFTQTHRLQIWINGTEYYLSLDTV